MARNKQDIGRTAVAVATAVVALGAMVGSNFLKDPLDGPRPITWASGKTIFSNRAEAVNVGHDIATYAEVQGGYVLADPQGQVWLWKSGEATDVGTLSAGTLQADGHYAAWVENSGAGAQRLNTLAVLNSTSGQVRRFNAEIAPAQGQAQPRSAAVLAMDGSRLYAADDRGLITIDLPSGTTRVHKSPTTGGDTYVLGVHAGKMLVNVDGQAYLTDDLTKPGAPLPLTTGELSPDAAHIVFTDPRQRVSVYDVATRKTTYPKIATGPKYTDLRWWLSKDTYTVLGLVGDPNTDLPHSYLQYEICTLDGTCEHGPKVKLSQGLRLSGRHP